MSTSSSSDRSSSSTSSSSSSGSDSSNSSSTSSSRSESPAAVRPSIRRSPSPLPTKKTVRSTGREQPPPRSRQQRSPPPLKRPPRPRPSSSPSTSSGTGGDATRKRTRVPDAENGVKHTKHVDRDGERGEHGRRQRSIHMSPADNRRGDQHRRDRPRSRSRDSRDHRTKRRSPSPRRRSSSPRRSPSRRKASPLKEHGDNRRRGGDNVTAADRHERERSTRQQRRWLEVEEESNGHGRQRSQKRDAEKSSHGERGTKASRKSQFDEAPVVAKLPAAAPAHNREGGSTALPPPPMDRHGRPPPGAPGGGPSGPQSQGEALPPPPAPPKPEFGLSGKLAEETNKVNGVVVGYTEPPEAEKPPLRWRLYIFKNGEMFGDPLYIHRQSAYLIGREPRVADIRTDHPSCSKQHAALQYRRVEQNGADGMPGTAVKPYLMDLGSTNGTYLNGERMEPQRYYELLEQDTIVFGNSSREYVLLHDKSAG